MVFATRRENVNLPWAKERLSRSDERLMFFWGGLENDSARKARPQEAKFKGILL